MLMVKLHHSVQREAIVEEQKELKIDLGCGPNPKPGYVGVDKVAGPGVQHVLDLEEAQLPFPDNSVSAVNADQLLEHINNLIPLMNEIYRVCRNGAIFHLWIVYTCFCKIVFAV